MIEKNDTPPSQKPTAYEVASLAYKISTSKKHKATQSHYVEEALTWLSCADWQLRKISSLQRFYPSWQAEEYEKDRRNGEIEQAMEAFDYEEALRCLKNLASRGTKSNSKDIDLNGSLAIKRALQALNEKEPDRLHTVLHSPVGIDYGSIAKLVIQYRKKKRAGQKSQPPHNKKEIPKK